MGPFLEVLQVNRRLLTRSECFRLERELAGPDFHRGRGYAFARHTKQRHEQTYYIYCRSDEGAEA